MLVIIIDNNELIKQSINSSYVYKKITINKKSISLNGEYFFSDGEREKNIKECVYEVIHNKEIIRIYVYNDPEDIHFELFENNGFSFGNKEENDIISNDQYLLGYYFILKNNLIQTNCPLVYVNDKIYKGIKLNNQDKVNILGFEFVYNVNFLYINDFKSRNKLSKYRVKTKQFKYEIINPSYNNYYIDTNNELIFKKIKDPDLPHKNKPKNFFLQLGPSLTMSFAMLFLAYINIEKSQSSNNLYDVLGILIMPITMLVSSLLWPIVSSIAEKQSYKKEYNIAKNNYLRYLEKYEKDVDLSINRYLIKEFDTFFYKSNILKRLFYIQKNSKDFINISLGIYTKTNDYDYEECLDEEINNKLSNIYQKINNIANHPLKLNLKKHKVITICSKNYEYLFCKYLLELSSKYHYNDLNIVIFDKSKKMLKNLPNIPHLFSSNIRLTFSEERDLNKINNIKKEIVILSFDKINVELLNNQRIIYFTNKYDILKDSDCIVEYKDNKGILYEESSLLFDYSYEQIDFKKCFDQLTYYYVPNFKNKILSFNDFFHDFDIENNYTIVQNSLVANFATIDGELINFDLHENKDGPHGLVGGSTGSGKSEMLISLLLSLCIKYRPDYLNIILIDYKGGGIASSLMFDGIVIPHIIGEISNLNQGTIERLIYALSFECNRRQNCFKEMSKSLNSSIVNIDEYNENLKVVNNMPKIAHLLIVIDEFAELKRTNPEIIKQLISFSRIGRSLGIHLILSTQKPNGIVDEEIWSNSHFKIALKLNDERDSQDIIKNKDAAYLVNPGEFILQVDNKSIKAETLYSKKDYTTKKEIKVTLLNNQYEICNSKSERNKINMSEAKYYTSKIIEVSKRLNIAVQSIDFDKPKEINRKDYPCEKYIMGTLDDYLNAKKRIISIPLEENIYIYTQREEEINSIINTLNENKKEMIIISNKEYKGGYIKESILYDEKEKIDYLFNHSQIFNYELFIIIEDYNSLIAYNDNYVNYIYTLIKKSTAQYLKVVLLTRQCVANYKILNLFKNRFVIGIKDQNDLITIFGKKSNYVNDCYYYNGDSISYVPCLIEKFNLYERHVDSFIKEIPDIVTLKQVDDKLLIGFDLLKREEVFINYNKKNLVLCENEMTYNKLEILFNRYNNVDVFLYRSSLEIGVYDKIIWVSGGIYKQMIFVPDLKNDLYKDEAYIVEKGKGRKIKFVAYE